MIKQYGCRDQIRLSYVKCWLWRSRTALAQGNPTHQTIVTVPENCPSLILTDLPLPLTSPSPQVAKWGRGDTNSSRLGTALNPIQFNPSIYWVVGGWSCGDGRKGRLWHGGGKGSWWQCEGRGGKGMGGDGSSQWRAHLPREAIVCPLQQVSDVVWPRRPCITTSIYAARYVLFSAASTACLFSV